MTDGYRRASWYWATGVAGFLACAGGPPVNLESVLRSAGVPLLPTDTTVVVLLDPADCLGCGVPVGAWLRWARGRDRGRLAIVLTRPATGAEREALAAARVVPIGILSGRWRGSTPTVYRWVGSELRDSAIGRPAAQAFMRQLLDEPSP